MKLSDRLTAVADVIRDCITGAAAAEIFTGDPVTVADIGCDHSFLGIYLCGQDFFKNGRVLACDLRKGPLDIAKENIEKAGLSDRIETRLSDGLNGIAPGEAGIITINGMGGELVFEILKSGEQVLKAASFAVVSPQSKLPAFRYCLRKCRVHTAYEKVVYDSGKYYHIFVLDELEKADFSVIDGFADPGIRELSFEDYTGISYIKSRSDDCGRKTDKVPEDHEFRSALKVYEAELLQKRGILQDAVSSIKRASGHTEALRIPSSDSAVLRLEDIEIELGCINKALDEIK